MACYDMSIRLAARYFKSPIMVCADVPWPKLTATDHVYEGYVLSRSTPYAWLKSTHGRHVANWTAHERRQFSKQERHMLRQVGCGPLSAARSAIHTIGYYIFRRRKRLLGTLSATSSFSRAGKLNLERIPAPNLT
jgi:hypothetical protein